MRTMSWTGLDNFVLLPPSPPKWLPTWAWIGPFREADPSDFLSVSVIDGTRLPAGEDGRAAYSGGSRVFFGRNLPRNGFYGVSYSRRGKQDFDATKDAIFTSLRLLE